MAMILRRVAPAIRTARIASSLIPYSLPPPTPVPIGLFSAARITPLLFRVPIRPIQTSSSNADAEMEKAKERIRRTQKYIEQYEKWENVIFILKLMNNIGQAVVYVLGAAFLWKITQKKTQLQQEMAADGNSAQDNSA